MTECAACAYNGQKGWPKPHDLLGGRGCTGMVHRHLYTLISDPSGVTHVEYYCTVCGQLDRIA